jgi:hypothetical protein
MLNKNFKLSKERESYRSLNSWKIRELVEKKSNMSSSSNNNSKLFTNLQNNETNNDALSQLEKNNKVYEQNQASLVKGKKSILKKTVISPDVKPAVEIKNYDKNLTNFKKIMKDEATSIDKNEKSVRIITSKGSNLHQIKTPDRKIGKTYQFIINSPKLLSRSTQTKDIFDTFQPSSKEINKKFQSTSLERIPESKSLTVKKPINMPETTLKTLVKKTLPKTKETVSISTKISPISDQDEDDFNETKDLKMKTGEQKHFSNALTPIERKLDEVINKLNEIDKYKNQFLPTIPQQTSSSSPSPKLISKVKNSKPLKQQAAQIRETNDNIQVKLRAQYDSDYDFMRDVDHVTLLDPIMRENFDLQSGYKYKRITPNENVLDKFLFSNRNDYFDDLKYYESRSSIMPSYLVDTNDNSILNKMYQTQNKSPSPVIRNDKFVNNTTQPQKSKYNYAVQRKIQNSNDFY